MFKKRCCYSIAILDASQQDSLQLKETLRQYGKEKRFRFHIHSFSDADHFLKSRKKFDFVFLDTEKSGKDLSSIIHTYFRDAKQTEFVLYSRQIDMTSIEYSLMLAGCFLKPFSKEEVCSVMNHLLHLIDMDKEKHLYFVFDTCNQQMCKVKLTFLGKGLALIE